MLARHGLHSLAGILSFEQRARRGSAGTAQPGETAVPARELRLAFEELGPTFIKLGQLLSTRADLLAPGFRSELAKLQDAAPPAPPQAIRETLESELSGGVDAAFAGRGVGELNVGQLIRALLDVSRRHRLRIPRDLSLLLRTILLEEGIVATLDSRFRLVDVLAPYARRHLFSGVTLPALLERLRDAGVDLAEMISDLPETLHRALDVVEDGGFDVHLRASELEPLMSRAERLGNRIALSVLAAALIDAGAPLLATRRRRRSRPAKRKRRR